MFKVIEALHASHVEEGNCQVVIAESKGVTVGLVTLRNIFEALEPEAFHVSQWSVPVFWPGLWVEQMRNLKDVKVYNHYLPVKMVGLQADAGIMRAVYCFNKTKLSALAVLEGNKPVGIIENRQVMGEIMQFAVDAG